MMMSTCSSSYTVAGATLFLSNNNKKQQKISSSRRRNITSSNSTSFLPIRRNSILNASSSSPSFLLSTFPNNNNNNRGQNGGLEAHRTKSHVWERRSSMFGRPLLTTERDSCVTCCLNRHHRSYSTFKLSTPPTVFFDKSSSRLLRHPFHTSAFKQHLPRATVGPDEPHAASTTWPDEVIENQDFDASDLEAFLSSELQSHPKVVRGQLNNGLRYLILPNKVPANRFEAHMEIHAGSIDEEDDEQGIAHMIEHVAFLGSKKREKLLGTGARSNAYTDFHHTVFHIHSPTTTQDTNESHLPLVLDALNEIAFYPKFLTSRVEKERRAILSELQMMNTIEYRVDCQLLQHLHSENKLSKRFPIGLEEQIKKWDADKIRKFHERWYFPANATLYIVGDIDNITEVISHIEAVFGQTGPENELPTAPSPPPNAFGAMASFLVPKLSVGLTGGFSQEKSSTSADQSKVIKRERHAVRPPVNHNWSLPGSSKHMNTPQIFQHELLQHFSINMFCKIPVSKVRTYGDLRNVLMKRIFLSALHFRINTRYKSSNPPFTSVELDHSDSGREGCTVTTLTITAEPKNWQNAIKVAVQEVRRLKEFGVTHGELTRYMDALLKDSEHLAAMIDNVSSVDNLDFIMESDALGHTVMDQRQGHESLVAVCGTVTLEEVNSIGAKVLEYVSDFGKPTAPVPAAIVACVPSKVHIDGVGESEFKISASEITEAIKLGLEQPIEAEPELVVPKELISPSELEALKLQCSPSFGGEGNVARVHDEETGITQLRLSNGIRVNYRISESEARTGVMRLIVGGGRATETRESQGAVVVGVRTLSEGGRVGNFSREQVETFCVKHLINCSLESTEEFIAMEFRFTLRDKGMPAAFQLLHMVLEHSVWVEDAFDRASQLYLSYYRSIPKSLERSTAHKLMLAMLNGDERFVEPTPNSLQNLTLDTVKDAVMSQFVGGNMEVSIVGDFSAEEIESCVLDYLGTVSATRDSVVEQESSPIVFRPSSELQSQQVFLKDTDERACAYIAGPAPNRWGFTSDGDDLFESLAEISIANGTERKSEVLLAEGEDLKRNKLHSHPLFFGITMGLLAEIINSRLFTTVRDSLGLTYDVSFELNLFDRLKLGWYVVSVTSTPEKVHKAVDACKSVLRGLHSNKIAQRELDRAKRTLLMRHEAEIKSNAYWLGLLAHLQASSVPRKDISCIKDLISLYEAATIEDVYLAYEQLKVDDDSLYSCIGIAGQGQDSAEIPAPIEDSLGPDGGFQGVIPVGGRGLSTMTRPTM
ncbi:hypothetical protein ACFE04_025942 [Oxalis oulophora]